MRTDLLVGCAALALLSLSVSPHDMEEPVPSQPSGDERGESSAEALLAAGFASLPDPTEWIRDSASDLLYRRTTSAEREANGWRPATFLVEARALAPGEEGVPSVTVLVPLADGQAVAVGLVLRSSHGAAFSATSLTHMGAAPSTPVAPEAPAAPGLDTVFVYGGASAEAEASLRAVEGGGFFARVALDGLVAELVAPEPWWSLSPVAAGGSVPEGPFALVALHAVPPDGTASPTAIPDPGIGGESYASATMGEIQWCTRHSGSWKSLIDQTAAEIAAGFVDTNAAIARKHDHCWFGATLADAQWCADTGPCYDGSGHLYPYSGAGTATAAYLDHAWEDVAHSRLHWSFDLLKLTQVVYDGADLLVNGDGQSLCGDARTPTMLQAGASVAMSVPQPTGCLPFVDTHETGHNFDATHDETVYGDCKSVMGSSASGGCRDDEFALPGKAQVDACVTDPACPRAGAG